MSETAVITSIIVILISLFVVLTERKLLSYAQRRMGPALFGRNGAFQLALDLVKLLTKEVFIVPRPSTSLAPLFLSLLYGAQLMFSQNFIFGSSLSQFANLDAVILYHIILILISNIFFLLVGFLSQSRYALISTVRAIVHAISLDIFITVIYSLLTLTSQSTHFHDFILIQSHYSFFILYAPASFTFIMLLLLEAKRAPFDHAETESEVVGGYQVEYSSSMLLMFYLAEYLHLVISSIHFVIFFLAGFWGINYLSVFPITFLTYCDTYDLLFSS